MVRTEENLVFVSFLEGTYQEREERLEKFFVGDTKEWAAYRAYLLGDLITPKFICFNVSDVSKNETPALKHPVYYVEHRGIHPRTEKNYHVHHVVCGCARWKNLNDGRGSVKVEACPILHLASNARARRLGKDVKIDIPEADELEADRFKLLTSSFRLTVGAIKEVLLIDKAKPEEWPGTVKSGELQIEQASELTGQAPENIVWYGDILQPEDSLTFDGQAFRLAA